MLAKCCLLMCEINKKRNNSEAILAWLQKAKDLQLKANKRAQIDNTDLLEEFNKMLSK
jgi:hypothetical protein